jgi:hypothetical protein
MIFGRSSWIFHREYAVLYGAGVATLSLTPTSWSWVITCPGNQRYAMQTLVTEIHLALWCRKWVFTVQGATSVEIYS